MSSDDQGSPGGYIKLFRRFFEDDPYWNKPREFSRAEAWIDLIQMAAFARRYVFVDNDRELVERGELLASRKKLCQRWNWTEKQVRCMFDDLSKKGQVRAIRETRLGQVYLVVKYEYYQGQGPSKGQEKSAEGPSKGQARAKQGPTIEEGRKKVEAGEEEKQGNGTLFESSARPTARPIAEKLPEIPEALDTAEFRVAWASRLDERASKGERYRMREPQARAQLRQLAKVAEEHGIAIAIECLEEATAAGWQGVVFKDRLPGAKSGNLGAFGVTASVLLAERRSLGRSPELDAEIEEDRRRLAANRAEEDARRATAS